MPKSDRKFVNTGKEQQYELRDWLYRNSFSTKQSNIDALRIIISVEVKKGITADNITWSELDAALRDNPAWFSSLDPVGK